MVNKAVGIYPIFIELRDFNNHYNYSLLEYICLELSDVKNKINTTSLEGLIKSGNLLLILDGFDELDFEIRNRYSREILDLSKKYKNINLLISTRPDETFKSWGQFYAVNINELDKKKATELVSKLRYNDVVKRQFMKKIDEELYDTHKSFIGNPLLLTMMLMTFQEFAEIPKKVYLFYEQAFQTLFLKHDSLKDLYIRKSRSGIDILGFKKVFSYFCIHTHLKKEISFSDIKNYVLTETAKIEKRDKGAEPEKRLYLEKADKIIDDFLGNFEEFRNSDSAISEFIKNNKEELGVDLKDLRGDTKFETDDNIKNFFINSIKNEIKIAVSEMVYEGSFENTKTYDNKKVEDFFKKRDELTQNIFDKSFAIDFNNSKYENQIKFLETNDKSIIFNLNDKYNAGGLGSFMSSYFDKEPALARPIISKSNMINWIEKLDTKKYNIGFEVKVDKDKKETQIEIEKENKREKDF